MADSTRFHTHTHTHPAPPHRRAAPSPGRSPRSDSENIPDGKAVWIACLVRVSSGYRGISGRGLVITGARGEASLHPLHHHHHPHGVRWALKVLLPSKLEIIQFFVLGKLAHNQCSFKILLSYNGCYRLSIQWGQNKTCCEDPMD